jgi:hypothetical protein
MNVRAGYVGETCPACGRTGLTWGDMRFGHPRPGQEGATRTCGAAQARAASTVSFDARSGYQSSLARFPGDPTAHVETPIGARKLEDRRLREGWVDKRDMAPDVRHVRDGRRGPTERTKKLAEALFRAAKNGDMSYLERLVEAPEDAEPEGPE